MTKMRPGKMNRVRSHNVTLLSGASLSGGFSLLAPCGSYRVDDQTALMAVGNIHAGCGEAGLWIPAG